MPLSDEQRVRYARHLLLPELGERAQLRLLASRVRFAQGAELGAREVAEEYLMRAGVRVSNAHAHAHAHVGADVGVDVGVDGDGDGDGDDLVLSPPQLNCTPSLHEAALALSGAYAAVEAIKTLAGIGQPAQLDLDLLVAEEV